MCALMNYEIIYMSMIAILSGVYVSSASHSHSATFSISSIFESAVSVAIHPLVAAGSSRCEFIKRLLGLTYEQMQEKSGSNIHDNLNIDFVTNKGNVRFNVTASELLERLIDNKKTTVVLAHGFLESSDGLMVKAVASGLLKMKDLDILALDGRKVVTLEYFRSTTYVRFIGEKLGSLLTDIIKNGQNSSNIILIGHSLGAHIVGIAGKSVKNLTGLSIGRIVALDPAGPCFSNIGRDNRLDRNDATFVDVIHTNGGILGLKDPIGDKDFYPNGGSSQPGCFFSTCDHSRAWEIFAESLKFPEQFPARKCDNWMFRSGHCVKNEVAFMGITFKGGSPGTYFLTTNSSPPFGLGAEGSG